MLQSSVMGSGMIDLILISTGLGHLMLDDTSYLVLWQMFCDYGEQRDVTIF